MSPSIPVLHRAAFFAAFCSSVAMSGEIHWTVLAREQARTSSLGGEGSRVSRVLETEFEGTAFGGSLDAGADLNGDGVNDLVVAGPFDRIPELQEGSFRSQLRGGSLAVYSGESFYRYFLANDSASEAVPFETVFGASVLGCPASPGQHARCILGRERRPDAVEFEACGAEVFDLISTSPRHRLCTEFDHDAGVGRSLAIVRDGARDARPLLALGAPDFETASAGTGAILFFDLESGALVRTLEAPPGEAGFGEALAASAVALGSPGGVLAATAYHAERREMSVSLFRGNGKLISRRAVPGLVGERPDDVQLACVGDLDDDHVPDWVLGLPTWSAPDTSSRGCVVLLPSRKGSQPRAVQCESADLRFGRAVIGVGDWNGDGTPDIAASIDVGDGGGERWISLLNGRTLEELERLALPASAESGGHSLAAWTVPVGTDGARVPRLAIGDPGRVWIVDAKR
ncbi:MAG: integrin alpha [Planctomycetes bacterium]|nr:integrin alpha [Planctomycetota bacterium]